jgi:hypothetical protein
LLASMSGSRIILSSGDMGFLFLVILIKEKKC